MTGRLLAALAAGAVAVAMAVPLAAASTSTSAAAQERSVVVYAKPTRAQFVDHNDDRERGDFRNPFDSGDVLKTPPNANSGKKGARAGDNAMFSFKLYSDAKLTRPIGNATYACTFTFSQEAICEVNVALTGGTMIAMGPTQLDGSTIVLPVTGGTGRYAGAHGQLSSKALSPKKNTQVIRFRLL